jgi:hypothetical protein
LVLATLIGVFARDAGALHGNETLLADQRRARRAGGDDPALRQIPPLHLPVPEPRVRRIDQVHGRGLAVRRRAQSGDSEASCRSR